MILVELLVSAYHKIVYKKQFIDEAHNFMSPAFAELLSECRKFKLGLFLTHQYLDQLADDTKSAILGNVGTMITFRLGTKDARVFQDEFSRYLRKKT